MRHFLTCTALLAAGCGSAEHPAAAPASPLEDAAVLETEPTIPPADVGDGPRYDAGPEAGVSWSAAMCPPPPEGAKAGYVTGNQLGPVMLKDCEDNDVSLDAFCGADALWIFGAHEWCPHCQQVARESENLYAKYAGKNVAAVDVLVQNTSGDKPTAADCRAWKATYHLEKVVALYDPNGALKPLWDNSYTALSVFVDRRRVIVSKTHTDDPVALAAGIDGALAH